MVAVRAEIIASTLRRRQARSRAESTSGASLVTRAAAAAYVRQERRTSRMRDRYDEASFRQAQPLLFFTFKPLALYRGLIIKAPTTLFFLVL